MNVRDSLEDNHAAAAAAAVGYSQNDGHVCDDGMMDNHAAMVVVLEVVVGDVAENDHQHHLHHCLHYQHYCCDSDDSHKRN